MPAKYLIISENESLVRAWEAQLPSGMTVVFDTTVRSLWMGQLKRIAVVILESAYLERVPRECERAHLLVVADADDAHIEMYKASWRGTIIVQGVEDSRRRLGQIATLCLQHAELCSLINGIRESGGKLSVPRNIGGDFEQGWGYNGGSAVWDFVAEIFENVYLKENLIRECLKGYKRFLECSRVIFLRRDRDRYVAMGSSEEISDEDPLVVLFEGSPVIVDGRSWPDDCNPITVLSIRNRMELWNSRLMVPVHDSGELLGIIVCGVRNDGLPHDHGGKIYAVRLASAMAQLLRLNSWIEELSRENRYSREYRKCFPNTLILNEGEDPPLCLPPVVRKIVGIIKTERSSQFVKATIDQPFRVFGGFVEESEKIWIRWEEASAEIYEQECVKRRDRIALLKELALTLNHELGNSLVSLAVLVDPRSVVPKALHAAIHEDINRLNALNDQISKLAAFSELEPEYTDFRLLVAGLGEKYGLPTEICSEELVLHVVPEMVELALNVVASCLIEDRRSYSAHGISLQLRCAGAGESLVVLISFRGKEMRLEGVLPLQTAEGPPTQGRMLLFIAKEVIRLHHGTIHSGPGLEDSEIMIALRHW